MSTKALKRLLQDIMDTQNVSPTKQEIARDFFAEPEKEMEPPHIDTDNVIYVDFKARKRLK